MIYCSSLILHFHFSDLQIHFSTFSYSSHVSCGNSLKKAMCHQFLYFSYITVTFVIEAMALANAIVHREYLQQMKRVGK
jgi:hypothetical protein